MNVSLKELIQQLLSHLNTVSTANITINTAGASGSGYVQKCGKVVSLSATITPTMTGTNLMLASIPSGYRPSQRKWLACGFYHSTAYEAEAYVEASGALGVSTTVMSVGLKISGTWITNE